MEWKKKFLAVLLAYFIISVYLTLYWKGKNGYYGYQDWSRYEDSYENFRNDNTHWLTIRLMDVFGLWGWPFLLFFLILPYCLYEYYRPITDNPWRACYQVYMFSPLIFLFLQENVFSQLLFLCFYLVYATNGRLPYAFAALLAHPAFVPALAVDDLFKKRYLRFAFFVIGGLCFLLYFRSYWAYSFLNLGDATSVFDVFLYMNPFNMLAVLTNPYYLALTILGLFAHNGRFLIFGILIQYIKEPPKSGKIWGLTLNLLVFYHLFTII